MLEPTFKAALKSTAKTFFAKLLACFCFALFAIALAALYGALNDQMTYSISPEYYAKFKFKSFKIEPKIIELSPRLAAAIVGAKATWWMGLILGLILGLFALMQRDWKRALNTLFKACLIVFLFIFSFSLSAPLLGGNSWVADDVVDAKSFILVGKIHTLAYLGAAAGGVAALIYLMMARTFDDVKAAKSKEKIS